MMPNAFTTEEVSNSDESSQPDLYRDAINTHADAPAAQPHDAAYRKHTDTETDEHTFTDEWIEEGVFDDDVAVDTPREGVASGSSVQWCEWCGKLTTACKCDDPAHANNKITPRQGPA